jgi:hypothetical protein
MLAAKLLRWGHHLGPHPNYVLMESWYRAKRFLKQIRAYEC